MRSNQRLAQLWLDALATELGAAAGTIETYTDDLNCYLTWLEAQNLGLQGVTLERLRDYMTDLDQRGYAGSTVARRITVVRGLHRFLIAEDLGSNNPTATMPAMRRPRKLPFVLSIDETEALLEMAHILAADASVGLYRQAGYARRAALFETLYASGMRISEALSLPSDALVPEPGCCWCAAKATNSVLFLSILAPLRRLGAGRVLPPSTPGGRLASGFSTRFATAPRL
jgi:integrase/recombinase XerD